MSVYRKKLAILQRLDEQTGPISLAELLKLLGNGYSTRTVRRWLVEMAEEGLIEKIGERKGTRYQAIQGARTSPFSSGSRAILEKVEQSPFKREPVSYDKGWLDAYQPDKTRYLSEMLCHRLAQAGERSQDTEPAGTYARRIYHRLLIDLSFNSSRLEGNTYSLLETEKLVLSGASAEGKLDEERAMILNHKEAIRYLVDNARSLRIDAKVIRTLHYLLADGLIEHRHAGNIRDHAVHIGGSVYHPLENPWQLEEQLEKICQKKSYRY